MKRLVVFVIAAAVAVGFLYWWFSPAEVLKRRTVSLLDILTIEAGQGRAARQLGAYSLHAMLAPELELDLPPVPEAGGTFTREEIESAHAWLCNHVGRSRFELLEFESVVVSGDAGEVVFSVDARVELGGRQLVEGVHQAGFHWRRGDDGWRLERASCSAAGH